MDPSAGAGCPGGNGGLEASKVVGGLPFALTRHLERLQRSGRGLGLPEVDEGAVRRGVAAVLGGALFVTGVVDLATGTGPFINETLHSPELLSVLLVWLLAVPSPRRPVRIDTAGGAGLRAVDDGEQRRAV